MLFADLWAVGMIDLKDPRGHSHLHSGLRSALKRVNDVKSKEVEGMSLPVALAALPPGGHRNGLELMAIYAVDLLSRATTSPCPDEETLGIDFEYWPRFRKVLTGVARSNSGKTVSLGMTLVAAWLGSSDAVEYRTLCAFADAMEKMRKQKSHQGSGLHDQVIPWCTYHPEEDDVASRNIARMCQELSRLSL